MLIGLTRLLTSEKSTAFGFSGDGKDALAKLSPVVYDLDVRLSLTPSLKVRAARPKTRLDLPSSIKAYLCVCWERRHSLLAGVIVCETGALISQR